MKKTLSLLLVALVCATALFTLVPTVKAEAAILNSSSVKGSDFTDSEALAKMLDIVFSGDIDIYNYDASNEVVKGEASMPLGTKMSTSAWFYIKSKASGYGYSGKQCYIYANAVYNKIFNEVVYNGSNFAHSKVVVSPGTKTASYDLFNKSNVRCGAYIRTTGNSSGAFNGNVGHSMIILSYDESYIIYLGGNQSGNGEIDIRKETWSEFNKNRISGVGRYISHVVQPTDEYYDKLYPSHKCTSFKGLGVCTECGKTYDWQSTFSNADAGTYKVIKDFTPRTNAPYTDATKGDSKIKKGSTVKVEGSYINAYNNKWIKFTYNGEVGYVLDDGYLELSSLNSLNVTCVDFKPTENASLPLGYSYNIVGTVNSNYPIRKIVAKIDGSEYATWTASNNTTTSVNISPTDINLDLKFANLSAGKHTVTLTATDIHGRTQTFLTRNFNMVSTACSHSYGSSYKTDANNHWKVCSKCGSTASVEAHAYTNSCDTTCNTCGATRSVSHTYYNSCDTSCDVCGATRSISHNYEYSDDAYYHWQECTICGEKTESELHQWELEETFDAIHSLRCEQCKTGKWESHKYDNACDKDCNVCEATRTTSHEYDNACDTRCNNCDAVRVTSHVYDNACDPSCNVCGATRTTNHKYSNPCDKNCDVCGATRSVPGHVYDHACDTSCNNCGYSRSTSHTYSNNCDASCNVCGATRTVSHTYTSKYSSNVTSHWRMCTSCGHNGYVEDHTPGLPATETSPQRCIVCEFVIQEAIGHTHQFGTDYEKDSRQHWHECSDKSCGAKADIEDHIFDSGVVNKEPTTTEKGEMLFTCTVCGEEKREDIDTLPGGPVEPEDPETPKDPELPDDSKIPEVSVKPTDKTSSWGPIIAVAVIGAVVGGGVILTAAVVTVVIVVKKQSVKVKTTGNEKDDNENTNNDTE